MVKNSKLPRFLIDLGRKDRLLADYKENPYRVMRKYGLSKREQYLVMEGSNNEIAIYLDDRKSWIIRPTPVPRPPSPLPGVKGK